MPAPRRKPKLPNNNGRASPDIVTEVCAIIDKSGLTEVPDDYALEGVAQGWLKEVGYHRDMHNRLVIRYAYTADEPDNAM